MWKSVVGYEGSYEVSDDGQVRSVDRVSCGRRQRGRVLVQQSHPKKKYRTVALSKAGTVFRAQVHRLVAEAFIPNPSSLPMVNHCDLVRTNNRVSNLEWVTRQENMDHAADVIHRGEQVHTAKITEDLVRQMRQRYADGERVADIARAMDIGYDCAYRAITRITWRHVK
jgi:hypothetical protein